ncbi:MAG: spore coat associated protein CotJA [Eubacteriaceae bacterium]|nr:spore coat associated protein CotJA [Eubacteriaceae bacterium]
MEKYVPMIPYMPKNPRLYHAYVPYQNDTKEYNLAEALDKGSLYVSLYSPYDRTVSGGECLC